MTEKETSEQALTSESEGVAAPLAQTAVEAAMALVDVQNASDQTEEDKPLTAREIAEAVIKGGTVRLNALSEFAEVTKELIRRKGLWLHNSRFGSDHRRFGDSPDQLFEGSRLWRSEFKKPKGGDAARSGGVYIQMADEDALRKSTGMQRPALMLTVSIEGMTGLKNPAPAFISTLDLIINSNNATNDETFTYRTMHKRLEGDVAGFQREREVSIARAHAIARMNVSRPLRGGSIESKR